MEVLENLMAAVRSVGRLPGRLASSSSSSPWASSTVIASLSASVRAASGSPRLRRLRRFLLPGERGEEAISRAVGSEGCEMLFCPTMTLPLARPAAMWWVKLELMAGITWTRSLGTPVILPRR